MVKFNFYRLISPYTPFRAGAVILSVLTTEGKLSAKLPMPWNTLQSQKILETFE